MRLIFASALGLGVAWGTLGTGCSPSTGNVIGGPHGGVSSGGGGALPASGGATGDPGGSASGGTDGLIQASDTGGATGSVDGGACGSQSLDTSVETVVVPGNVLIVFDQSDSMKDAFGTDPKWKVAADALVTAMTPVADTLTIGAVFFPSTTLGTAPFGSVPFGDCDETTVAAIDDATSSNPQIPFQPGPQFLTAWTAHWARNPLTLGTPTVAGLQRGAEALQKANLTGSTVTILVTDGAPTCGTNQEAIDVATKWKAANVPTYVIGLPGAGSAGAKVATLSDVAAAGGTTDYVLPSDGAALAQVFSSITSKIVKRSVSGCDINFNTKPPDLTKVFLVVTEAASGKKFSVKQGADGWTLDPAGPKATLTGTVCQDAMNGRFSSISFAFGCVDEPFLQ